MVALHLPQWWTRSCKRKNVASKSINSCCKKKMENLCSWQDRTKKDWLTDSLEGRPLQYILHFFLSSSCFYSSAAATWCMDTAAATTISFLCGGRILMKFNCVQLTEPKQHTMMLMFFIIIMTMIVCNIIRCQAKWIEWTPAMFWSVGRWGNINMATVIETKWWCMGIIFKRYY